MTARAAMKTPAKASQSHARPAAPSGAQCRTASANGA
ncbi:Uncharacterised protein [Mycobacteroides abscessus]|nr:Uncharacterised protein [Mycobacteroides abscessus]